MIAPRFWKTSRDTRVLQIHTDANILCLPFYGPFQLSFFSFFPDGIRSFNESIARKSWRLAFYYSLTVINTSRFSTMERLFVLSSRGNWRKLTRVSCATRNKNRLLIKISFLFFFLFFFSWRREAITREIISRRAIKRFYYWKKENARARRNINFNTRTIFPAERFFIVTAKRNETKQSDGTMQGD